MRKFLALLVLLTIAAFWSGCGKDSPTNSNTGTTVYNANHMSSNSATTTAPSKATGAPSGGGANTSANSTNGAPTHIKPPT